MLNMLTNNNPNEINSPIFYAQVLAVRGVHDNLLPIVKDGYLAMGGGHGARQVVFAENDSDGVEQSLVRSESSRDQHLT